MFVASDYFRHERALPADDDKMFVGFAHAGSGHSPVADQPGPPIERSGRVLCRCDGRLRTDTNSFWRLYGEVDVGVDALIAVVNTQGRQCLGTLQSGRRQHGGSIAGITSIFEAMQASIEGSWEGSSGLDNADRIFRLRLCQTGT